MSRHATNTGWRQVKPASCMQENRRCYRELFYTADIGDSISGAILFKETLYQAASDGTPFVDCLSRLGVFPGIKVDEVKPGEVNSVSMTSLLWDARSGWPPVLKAALCILAHVCVCWVVRWML